MFTTSKRPNKRGYIYTYRFDTHYNNNKNNNKNNASTISRVFLLFSVWWTPTSSSFGSHGKRRDVAVEFGDAVLFGAPDDGDANRSRGIAERVYGSREDAPDG